MKKHFLRWWYTITGQKSEAEYFLGLALLAHLEDDGKGMRFWKQHWGHILDVFKDVE